MRKIKLQKIVGHCYLSFENRTVMERSSRNFTRPRAIENSRQDLRFRTGYFTESSR